MSKIYPFPCPSVLPPEVKEIFDQKLLKLPLEEQHKKTIKKYSLEHIFKKD
jgi:hypothetical protein